MAVVSRRAACTRQAATQSHQALARLPEVSQCALACPAAVLQNIAPPYERLLCKRAEAVTASPVPHCLQLAALVSHTKQ